MELEIGSILDGKVTGIKAFGAFVSLPGGRSGLVHISEVAYSYVNDVTEFLSVGQDVKVKVISVDDNNRINLSIKQTQPAPERPARPQRPERTGERPERTGDRRGFSSNGGGSRERSQSYGGNRERSASYGGRPAGGAPYGGKPAGGASYGGRPAGGRSAQAQPKEPQTFEDMMKQFMSESESRQSELNRFNDRGPTRRRKSKNG